MRQRQMDCSAGLTTGPRARIQTSRRNSAFQILVRLVLLGPYPPATTPSGSRISDPEASPTGSTFASLRRRRHQLRHLSPLATPPACWGDCCWYSYSAAVPHSPNFQGAALMAAPFISFSREVAAGDKEEFIKNS